jgi:hypothetical protein
MESNSFGSVLISVTCSDELESAQADVENVVTDTGDIVKSVTCPASCGIPEEDEASTQWAVMDSVAGTATSASDGIVFFVSVCTLFGASFLDKKLKNFDACCAADDDVGATEGADCLLPKTRSLMSPKMVARGLGDTRSGRLVVLA